jgi:hypothetical protein
MKLNIPVKDQDFATFVADLLLTGPRGNTDVVEKAKSHGFVVLRMMTRRPNNSDAVFDLVRGHRQASLNGATTGEDGRREGKGVEVDRISGGFQSNQFVIAQIYGMLACSSITHVNPEKGRPHLECSSQRRNGLCREPTQSPPLSHLEPGFVTTAD